MLVIAAASISASAYHLFIQFTPLELDGFRGAFRDWMVWQLVVWSPWVVLGPLVVLYAERLMVTQRATWRRVSAHVVICSAIVLLSAYWYVTVTLQPILGVAPLFREFAGGRLGVYLVYTRWMMPALIAVYVGMVMWATRGLLVGLHAMPSGLIAEKGPSAGRAGRLRPAIAYDSDDLSILAVNADAVQVYGRSPDEFLRMQVTDLMTPETASTFGANHARSTGWFLWGGTGVHVDIEGEEFEVDYFNQQVSLDDRVAELLLITDLTGEIEARTALRESELRAAELKLQLANARLRALQLQLKPHFLFNTLNTVAMMIRTADYEHAQQVVTMLGDIFRRLLEFESESTVPLGKELEFVRLYLGLQQQRFFDRVEVRTEISPEALEVPVPTLILQPLVENAIHHGVAGMTEKCSIVISAAVKHGRLLLSLSNDVPADRPDKRAGSGHGVGLRNTRERLAEHHGDAASVMLEERPERFTITLELPA